MHLLDLVRGIRDTFVQANIFDFGKTEIVDFLGRISMGASAIDSSRRGGSSGGSGFGRRCGVRNTLFYFDLLHTLYGHVVSILDFWESRKIADLLYFDYRI